MKKLNKVKGYKVFNSDWTCRDFEYKIGGLYNYKGEIEPCKKGFHFCKKLVNCFEYYDFKDCKIAEIEAWGTIIDEGIKSVTDNIKIIRKISTEEAILLLNIGNENIGIKNTGHNNKGNNNTGNCNIGDDNTGCGNKGYSNSGDYNDGIQNTGTRNLGNYNSGCNNNGRRNAGDCNEGYCNVGDFNIGGYNTGSYNIGNGNTGNNNEGNDNTGNDNEGNGNIGNGNIGNYNTGNWNKGNYLKGYFNTGKETINLFNKPTNLTLEEFKEKYGHICDLLKHISGKERVRWVLSEYTTPGGQLEKTNIDNVFTTLTKKQLNEIKKLPNFDSDIFYEITGIRI